jgi:dolichyl-phosphate beta-glucosyltransferase
MNVRRLEEPSKFSYEVIVVNDGSKDRTSEVARGFVERYGCDTVRLMDMGVNRGKGAAVRQGARAARGSIILMLDADGATEISDLARLERALARTSDPENAIIIGNRKQNIATDSVDRQLHRRFLSWGFNMIVRLLLVSQQDTQCGFKIFTRRAAQSVFTSQHVERWAFDLELLFVAQKFFGIEVVEVPVNWVEVEGSKMTLGGLLNMARDILMIRVLYLLGVWKVHNPQQSV